MRRSPLKRRHQNSGRAAVGRVNGAHRQWVRGHACAVPTCEPDRSAPGTEHIEAHHVRRGGDGGMGLKSNDATAIPLCSRCHKLFHDLGIDTFEARTGLDVSAIAADLARRSPHLRKLEQRA